MQYEGGWTLDKVFELYVEGKDQPVRSTTLTLPASIYEMVDTVERVYLPTELRDTLGLEPGGFMKLVAEKDSLRLRKVHLIEMGDLSPETIKVYVRAATAAMSQEKQIKLVSHLLEQARKE